MVVMVGIFLPHLLHVDHYVVSSGIALRVTLCISCSWRAGRAAESNEAVDREEEHMLLSRREAPCAEENMYKSPSAEE